MAQDELATVELFRFNPEVDSKPRYTEFKELSYKGHTVKDVLAYIYENRDSSFAFRWVCNRGLCRCCTGEVNGQPVLSCQEPASKHMKIEPHHKFKILKDLV